MRGCRVALLLLVTTGMTGTVDAESGVQLTIRHGRVWLVTRDAAISQILAEWARVGQTRIVNGERLRQTPMTLELADVPEQQALDVVLRSASGFIAVPRTAPLADRSAALSQFERVVILPTSVAPPDTATRAAAPVQAVPRPAPALAAVTIAPGVQRLIGPDGQPVPDDQQDAPPGTPTHPATASMPPGFSPPPQVAPPEAAQSTPRPSAVPTAPPGAPVPGMIPQPPAQPGQPGQAPPPRQPR